MKKIHFIKSSIIISLFLLIICTACKKEEPAPTAVKKADITIESHKSGSILKYPLPVVIKGKIKNYKEVTGPGKGFHIYLIEQSSREKIWHIEPEAAVDRDGNWTALTWLGNRFTGNRSKYNLCVFASGKELKLKNGNHPVKDKPENIGETCIELNRKD